MMSFITYYVTCISGYILLYFVVFYRLLIFFLCYIFALAVNRLHIT